MRIFVLTFCFFCFLAGRILANNYLDPEKQYPAAYLNKLEKAYLQNKDFKGLGFLYKQKFIDGKNRLSTMTCYKYGLLAKEYFYKSGDSSQYYHMSWVILQDTYFSGLLKGNEIVEISKILRYFRREKKNRNEILALLTLAGIYSQKRDYQSTKKILTHCIQKLNLPICDSANYRNIKGRTHSELSCNYLWQYQIDFLKQDLQNAHIELEKSKEYCSENTLLCPKWLINNNNYFEAIITEFEGHYRQALNMYKKQLNRADIDIVEKNELYLRAGVTAFKMKNYLESSFYFNKSFALREKIRKEAENEYHFLPNLLQFDLEKKETEAKIADLEKKRTKDQFFFTLLLASICIAFVMLYAIWLYQKKQNQIKLLEVNQTLALSIAHTDAQEQERKRIAQDLHDSLGALLMSTQLALDKGDITLIQKKITEAQVKTREISYNLFAFKLQTLGLNQAIESLCQDHNELFEGKVIYLKSIKKEVPEGIWLGIYRIVEEILNNAIKHAKASQIIVQLVSTNEELRLSIEDDGIGFDPHLVGNGLGLSNIQARAKALCGELIFETQGHTTVLLKIIY